MHDPANLPIIDTRLGKKARIGRPIAPDANLKGVAMKAYQIVDADFVKREIGRMPIVDVRPPLRYDTAHIPSAINIRLDVAAASDDPAEELAEMFQDNGIFPEDAVIVYCQMGVHAKIACDYLASAGYSRAVSVRRQHERLDARPGASCGGLVGCLREGVLGRARRPAGRASRAAGADVGADADVPVATKR